MKAILVDDEPLALRELERQLNKLGGVEIAAAFLDPNDAIAGLASIRPDIVFLDIDMPDMNGLEAAEHILQWDSSIDIVFVTAYEEYAVKAFELNALDYVLKPLFADRLSKTLERVKLRKNSAVPQAEDQPVVVCCFQQIAIEYGQADPFPWRTAKAQELFAFLVYRRHQNIRKDVLIDILWPHMEMKRAYSLLYTTIYQLRKSFETAGLPLLIKSSANGYTLYLANGTLDIEEWEQGLNQTPAIDEQSLPQHLRLLDMYRGDFLADHDYEWAENERNRLMTLWHQHALAIGRYLQEEGRLLEAVAIYLRIRQVFPYSDANYWTIIQLYADIGDRAAVEHYYEQFIAMLEEEYGEVPAEEVQEWYARWNGKAE